MTESVRDKTYHYALLEENRRKSVEHAEDLNKSIIDLASVAPPPTENVEEALVKLPAFEEVDYRLMHALEETEKERRSSALRLRRRKTSSLY
jgi:hypothetical protein